MNTNWKGAYGYDTKHSIYFNQYRPQKTQTDIGVGTRQQTIKRCGIVKPEMSLTSYLKSQPNFKCDTGTCSRS